MRANARLAAVLGSKLTLNGLSHEAVSRSHPSAAAAEVAVSKQENRIESPALLPLQLEAGAVMRRVEVRDSLRVSGSRSPKYYSHLAGANGWRKTGERGQLTKDLVGHTEELGIYPEGHGEPLKDLSRRVTQSDLCFGRNTLVVNNWKREIV